MPELKRINCEQASALCTQADTQLIDVRDSGSFSASHIRQAQHIDNQSLADFIASADDEKPLVIYCYHGNSSQQAGHYFIQQGFTDVYSVDGGFEEWRLAFPNDLADQI